MKFEKIGSTNNILFILDETEIDLKKMTVFEKELIDIVKSDGKRRDIKINLVNVYKISESALNSLIKQRLFINNLGRKSELIHITKEVMETIEENNLESFLLLNDWL